MESASAFVNSPEQRATRHTLDGSSRNTGRRQISVPRRLRRDSSRRNGLTEEGTAKTIAAGGMRVDYHDVGAGEPVLFLRSHGPGTTAWITFHKVVGALSEHFRCI
jgi:hypothetical protein